MSTREEPSEPSKVVIDASAALATLQNEPGAEAVDVVASRAIILTVNLCEVVTKLAREGVPFTDARAAVESLGFQTVPFDDELAYLSASLVTKTKHLGLSLGDRACLALAIGRQLPVLTAEKRWQEARLPVDVRLIR